METFTEQQKAECIFFYENEYNRISAGWNFKIIPAIRTLRDKYIALDIGDFTTEIFYDLVNFGTHTTKSKYINKVKKAVEHLPKALQDLSVKDADTYLAPIAKAIEDFKEIKNAIDNLEYGNFRIDLSHCTIEDNEPILNEKEFKKAFEVVPESDTQKELHAWLLDADRVWNGLDQFVKKQGFQGPILNNYVFIDPYGKLTINLKAIKFIDKLPKHQ